MDEDEGVGIPEWVVTFGDMMSLLLTFFIMLVSLSEMKHEEKFQAMVESMRKQFGYDRSQASVMPGRAKPRNSNVSRLATTGRARRMDVMQGGHRSKAPVGSEAPPHNVSTGDPTEGVTVSFVEGSIELTAEAKELLLAQAESLRGKPQRIEIRGHTTRKPIERKTPMYKSNWDLGYARCREVMRFLIVEAGLAEHRLLLSQSGGFEPVPKTTGLSNSISQRISGKTSDARVQVIMLDQYSVDAITTAGERIEKPDLKNEDKKTKAKKK